jgi:inosine/xanthosine triphosphatase
MKVHVGSKNKTKIQAVKDALVLYPNLFPNPQIKGIDVTVELFGHPKNLQETIEGAIQRAKQAFTNCDISFGIEGGLLEVPYTRTGFMETGICAIYDGKNIYLGMGPAYEWPPEVIKLIRSGKADGSKAFKDLGYTHHEKLGAEKGGITGFLTHGRLTRENFTAYSVIMALIQVERPQLYR